MAVIATVLSCVMMGVLGVSGALTGWKRMLAVGAVVGRGLVGFFLFPPIELIQRFFRRRSGTSYRLARYAELIRSVSGVRLWTGRLRIGLSAIQELVPYFDQDYAHSDYLQGLAN